MQTYSIDFQVDDGVLVVTVAGTISSEEQAAEKAMKVVAMGLNAGVARVLLDERDLDISLDVLEIVNVAKILEERGVQLFGARMACLFNPDCRDVYNVYETVYKNRALNYRVFDDPDRAVAWLKG